MMGKTRIEELCYELYGSSKQHDSWQRYAMVRELRELMKRPKASGSDHFERSGDKKQLPVIDDETDLLGTGTIVDPTTEICETLVHKAILEEKSTSQFQVPIANSEIVRISEPGKVDLGLGNEESVELNENLEQEGDQKNAKKKTDVVGEVERDQKVMSDTKIYSAHQLFDQMTLRIASKEKRRKSLKAWKFKFKTTSKRSKWMDDRFSFVEETALLNKDPKETMWDYVKKEFKETMAACWKKRVDRFKLVEEKESRLEVLDLNQTLMYHQIGHGVDTLLVLKSVVHDKEMAVVRQRATSLMICDCSKRSSRANRVWEPGGLLCVQDHSGGSILMRTQRFHGLHLQGFIYMDMKFQEVIVVNVETGSKEHSHESFGSKGLAYDGCVILGMNFAGFERGEAELLATSQKMQKMDLFSFGIHTKMEEDLKQQQGDIEPLVTVPDLDAKPALRISMRDIQKRLNQYMVLLLTPVAYATHFSGGVGMGKKQSCFSLQANRVWDPGGSNSEND